MTFLTSSFLEIMRGRSNSGIGGVTQWENRCDGGVFFC